MSFKFSSSRSFLSCTIFLVSSLIFSSSIFISWSWSSRLWFSTSNLLISWSRDFALSIAAFLSFLRLLISFLSSLISCLKVSFPILIFSISSADLIESTAFSFSSFLFNFCKVSRVSLRSVSRCLTESWRAEFSCWSFSIWTFCSNSHVLLFSLNGWRVVPFLFLMNVLRRVICREKGDSWIRKFWRLYCGNYHVYSAVGIHCM